MYRISKNVSIQFDKNNIVSVCFSETSELKVFNVSEFVYKLLRFLNKQPMDFVSLCKKIKISEPEQIEQVNSLLARFMSMHIIENSGHIRESVNTRLPKHLQNRFRRQV